MQVSLHDRLPTRVAGAGGPRRRRLACAALAAALLAAAPLRAERWYVHYDNAQRALAAGQWRRAVDQLQRAIEQKGDSGVRVRSYGMKVVDYYPYLLLGIAYHRLGQYDAALQAFDTEERLGVVNGLPDARAELERYRSLAREARDAATKASGERAAELGAQNLAEARRLADRGDLDGAMAAAGRALALQPDDAEAGELMTRLRQQVAARDREREEERTAATNLEAARRELEAGRPAEAASLLRLVLATRPSDEGRRLLAEAQGRLAAGVEAGERARRVADGVARARRLAASGATAAALAALEPVLALAPADAGATALRSELLATLAGEEKQARQRSTLVGAEADLAAGRFEAALAAANRLLADAAGDPRALDVLRRAFAGISRGLLASGTAAAGNIPPAIRFVDQRQELEGGLAERVGDPDFRLSGVAIDREPVTIAVLDGMGRRLPSESRTQAVGEYQITEFRLSTHVAPGTTTFRVLATDAGGLASTGEYAVVYRRPWYRSPWLPASALLLSGGVLVSVLVARSRRRRKRLRRRFNPYVAGGPVFAEELFFGREPLIQRILQTIHTNSLLLHGERRIGKTSILHQLRRRLEGLDDPEYRFVPAYVDLQGTPEERFFATLADQLFDALAPLGVGSGRQPALTRGNAYGHHELVRELRDALGALQACSDKRVKLVLLIDEVDELNHYDPRVNQKLRSLFMKQFAESLVAVVAGVQIRKEWDQESSPWYNFFEEVAVQAISPEEARALVLRPIRGVFRVEAGVAERIAEAAGGRPFLIQRRCLALVHRLHAVGRRTITVEDVEALERDEADGGGAA